MCDMCCQSCWSKNFYQQYLEQHSAMMHQLHQGIPSHEFIMSFLPAENPAVTHPFNAYTNNQTDQLPQEPLCNAMMQQLHQGNPSQEFIMSFLPAENLAVTHPFNAYTNNQTDQLPQEPLQWIECNELNSAHQHQKKRAREFSSSTDESSSDESDVSRDDIIGSDDEIYFDPGCFIHLKDSEESSSEKSDDDDEKEKDEFEIVDSVIEEFEYVQLDKFGNMSENRKGRKGRPQIEKEMKIEKEIREHLYGEKADTIAGLETAMSLDFNRLCDSHQPHLWPVLPVRLSKV